MTTNRLDLPPLTMRDRHHPIVARCNATAGARVDTVVPAATRP